MKTVAKIRVPILIDWELMESKYWHDTDEDNSRKRRREAEFLIHKFCPWTLVKDRTYAKTPYIAHDNFDELHALSRALAELCGTQSPNYFYSKTNSNSSQITFILIEGCFN